METCLDSCQTYPGPAATGIGLAGCNLAADCAALPQEKCRKNCDTQHCDPHIPDDDPNDRDCQQCHAGFSCCMNCYLMHSNK